MTRNVITATPDMPLDESAILLEMNTIKRVPIVKNGQLVGIVSRANFVQAVASAPKGLGNSSHRFSPFGTSCLLTWRARSRGRILGLSNAGE